VDWGAATGGALFFRPTIPIFVLPAGDSWERPRAVALSQARDRHAAMGFVPRIGALASVAFPGLHFAHGLAEAMPTAPSLPMHPAAVPVALLTVAMPRTYVVVRPGALRGMGQWPTVTGLTTAPVMLGAWKADASARIRRLRLDTDEVLGPFDVALAGVASDRGIRTQRPGPAAPWRIGAGAGFDAFRRLTILHPAD
jgi:hypothetical protein